MALRGQPYFPFYPDDFLSDEKLSLCSAESTGVYIRLMCLMHKSDEYGVILLKQKFKQNSKQTINFACLLSKQMPYEAEVIERALDELIDEEVIVMDGNKLIQKRMVRDEKLSNTRALSGQKGGKRTQSKGEKFASDFALAKSEANTVNVIVNGIVNEDGNEDIKKVMDYYMDKINATPSPVSCEELLGYIPILGPDVIIRAMSIALDEKKTSWSYIKTILQNWTAQAVKSLSDVQRLQDERDAAKAQKELSTNRYVKGGRTEPRKSFSELIREEQNHDN